MPTFSGDEFNADNVQYQVEGDRGAGGVQEIGEERAGGGISTMAGSGREIQKGSQRNEPNNVS